MVLGLERSLFPVIAAMIGGTGFVWGPMVGAGIIRAIDVTLKNYIQLPIPALGIYGLILMLIALLMPRGILPALSGFGARRALAARPASRDGEPAATVVE